MIFEKKIKEIFRSLVMVRYDDTGLVKYFSLEDFPRLISEDFSFIGNKSQILRGKIYSFDGAKDDRLIVFDHGMGGGHTAYMKEIVELCKMGYTVLSYDHTGCMSSEGENICGLSQSLADLDYAIRAVLCDERFSGRKISVVGHSWGAFSTLNISAIHKDITHIVALSGFISVKDMLKQYFPGILSLYVPAIYKTEIEAVGSYAEYSAIESLKASSAKAMIIHSDDDAAVSFKKHFAKLRSELCDRENTVFVAVTEKGHNPNFTKEAVKIKDVFFADLTAKTKSGYFTSDESKRSFKESYDFDKMSEQDSEIWAKISAFLET